MIVLRRYLLLFYMKGYEIIAISCAKQFSWSHASHSCTAPSTVLASGPVERRGLRSLRLCGGNISYHKALQRELSIVSQADGELPAGGAV